ncbi:MAG: pilus assembly protein PilP [candidate division WOR-3 bacterium]|nr:pilus assembly protein PilP [candidate division WOR-3 bacterium]
MVSQVVGSLLFVMLINQTPTTPPADTLFPVEKWQYNVKGRRDPFVPLVGTDLSPGGKASHLSVENLTLIGILWGERGYYALVKDGVNQGYILKRGDRVVGGKVSEIVRDGVIFELTQAGVVTKYELRLQEKERR